MAAAQKRKKVLVAAVCAVVATGAFVTALTLNKGPATAVAAPASGGTAQILVSLVPLSPGARVTAAEVRLVPYPASAVTADNVTNLKDAVGKFVSVRLIAGAVILGSELEASDTSAVARTLRPGDVAISIPFDEVKGVGGYVQAEDRIDIICQPGENQPVMTCFHNVRVLRSGSLSQVQTPPAAAAVGAPVIPVGGATTPAAGPAPVSGALVIVVELSHADAERVSELLIGGKTGSIVRYALLNPADATPSPTA
ncbi:MAG: Flp pilus assembly protein CpaB [Candidatus Dormibacteria bacterium]